MSYYVTTISESSAYNAGLAYGQGVAAGTYAQTSLVILAMGAPASQTNNGTTTYGVILYGTGAFESTQYVAQVADYFAKGFYYGTGSDTTAFLYEGIGANTNSPVVGSNHGAAWAGMVTNVNSYLSTYGYSAQASAYGAFDIESTWPSGYNASFSAVKAEVDAFASGGSALFYNYGSANGCPIEVYNDATCSDSASPHWTQNNYYYVSWAGAALPLPENYNTTLVNPMPPPNTGWTSSYNAMQWAAIAEYAYSSLGQTMAFSGSLSQDYKCNTQGYSCSGTNLTYDKSYQYLYYALNDYGGLQQTPFAATDFKQGW